jgi:hypothetical protein
MVRGCASVQDHGILFKRVEFFPRIPWRSTCRSLFASRQGSRFGRVAQLVEHSTLNRLVAGSIPAASTIYINIIRALVPKAGSHGDGQVPSARCDYIGAFLADRKTGSHPAAAPFASEQE